MRALSGVLMGAAMGMVWQSTAHAEVQTFRTLPRDDRNLVQFTSDAPLEKVVGKTHDISGTLALDLSNLMATTNGTFEVDLRTLDTDNRLRNEHMREDHLETDKYPKATFTLRKFLSADRDRLVSGGSADVMAEGELLLHGISKVYQIPVRLRYQRSDAATENRLGGNKGDLLEVKAAFVVKLADHQIRRPELLFMRLAEEQNVEVSFAMTDGSP